MSKNLDVTPEDDKQLAPTEPLPERWSKEMILRHLQSLAMNAPESTVRLKAMEHLLEHADDAPVIDASSSIKSIADETRRKLHGEG